MLEQPANQCGAEGGARVCVHEPELVVGRAGRGRPGHRGTPCPGLEGRGGPDPEKGYNHPTSAFPQGLQISPLSASRALSRCWLEKPSAGASRWEGSDKCVPREGWGKKGRQIGWLLMDPCTPRQLINPELLRSRRVDSPDRSRGFEPGFSRHRQHRITVALFFPSGFKPPCS